MKIISCRIHIDKYFKIQASDNTPAYEDKQYDIFGFEIMLNWTWSWPGVFKTL